MLSQLKRNKIALSDSEKANERKLIHTVFKLNIVMKIKNIILEEYKQNPDYVLWEGVGLTLKEAALTKDQIQQIFRDIESNQSASGDNRSAIGQVKDAAGAVKDAYNKFKDKIYNSTPMKDFAAKYDQAAEQLKQASGGDDGAMKYVEKYRAFAAKHPIVQSFVYGALIAAIGISGAGVGGAAALGVLKAADKLLQGQDIRSAIYQGAKTGAIAYGASKLGDFIRGDKAAAPQSTNSVGTNNPTDDATRLMPTSDFEEVSPKLANYVVSKYPPESFEYRNDGMNLWIYNKETGAKQAMFDLMNDSVYRQERPLSEGQVYLLLRKISQHEQLTEGPIWDKVKGVAGKAAGAVAKGAKAVGHQLTTKNTYEKLYASWKIEGSPTDSEQLKTFLKGQGVSSAAIEKTFADMKIGNNLTTQSSNYKDIKTNVMKLNTKERQRIMALLQKQLGTI
jgi:hypothetical protein